MIKLSSELRSIQFFFIYIFPGSFLYYSLEKEAKSIASLFDAFPKDVIIQWCSRRSYQMASDPAPVSENGEKSTGLLHALFIF